MQRFWDTDTEDSGVSQIFKLMVSTSEKKLKNVNGVVWRQVK